ncbi:hypothetical protein [Streptomyces humi]
MGRWGDATRWRQNAPPPGNAPLNATPGGAGSPPGCGAVEQRLRASGQPQVLQARALVSAALSCLDVAATVWTEVEGGPPLTNLVDDAFAAVRS